MTDEKISQTNLQLVDWERIFSLYPAEYLHCHLNALALPPKVKDNLKFLSTACLLKNQKRLRVICRLAALAETNNIPLLFVKGAAEIAEHAEKADYMYSRTMADIDVIAHSMHVPQLHKLLSEDGNRFYDYGLAPVFKSNRKALNQYILDKTGHLVYNHSSPTDEIELHRNVTNDSDLKSYPPIFLSAIWKDARTITLEKQIIHLPSPEHILVQSICHAASPKNVIFFPDSPLRQKTQSLDDYINLVLNCSQLRFLCQLHLMLKYFTSFDVSKVQELLSKVNSPLLEEYVALASYYIKDFGLRDNVTAEEIAYTRKHNITANFLRQDLRYKTVKLLNSAFTGGRRALFSTVF